MANFKFSQLPVGAPLTGAEIIADSQGGASVQHTIQDIAEFVGDVSFNYGNGIAYDAGTNTVSADINVTNLQFTANQINTIQDIDLTASPTFETMTLTSTTAGFLMPRMTTVEFDAIPTPENGLVAWSQSSNRFRVNKGFPGVPNYDELAYFNDIPQDTTAFGEVYFQGNSVETVISALGVPAKVDGVYNPGDLLSFTNGSGLLTYTGLETKEFAINLSLTTTLNLSTADISVIVFINGAALAKTEQGTFTGSTTPGFQSTSVNALVELNTGDIVEVFVKNNTSTDNITVKDLNLNVSTVGGAIGNLSDQVVIAWDNSTNPVSVSGGTDIDITGGVISYIGTSSDNVVVSWDSSTLPVDVTAGTDIDITNGVISYTGGGAVTGPNGNFQLWEMTSPTLPADYTLGSWLSVTNTAQGDKFINPNQLEIGEQAIMEFTFELVPVNISTVTQISGQFRWTFGPYFYELADMIIGNPITTRSGTLKYTVTRINQNEVSIDVNGYYVNSSGEFVALLGNPGLVPNTFSYNANNTYLMEIEYRPNQGTAQQYLGVEAINNTVEQHTSREGSGSGGGIVTRWDGSTQDVEVTAGNLMTITNGSISTSAEQNVVTSVEGVTTPTALSAGSGIAISSGVISATGPGTFQQYILDAICLSPRQTYSPTNTYETAWNSLTGPVGGPLNNVPALAVGDSVQMRVSGVFTTTSTGGGFGNVRMTFGNTVVSTSPQILITGANLIRPFEMTINIANVGNGLVMTSVGGGYFDAFETWKQWGMTLTPIFQSYTPSSQLFELEWRLTSQPGFLNFEPRSLVIERLIIQ